MTWLWHTFSSSLIVSVFSSGLMAVTVSGKVELRDSRDASVKAGDYSGVVVWLKPLAGSAPVGSSPAHERMAQTKKTFSPHIMAIQVGTKVAFPNNDPIFHNAFSNFDGQLFDIGLYPPGTSRTVKFDRPGVVRVFCNIHPTMSAVIVVLDTPYFAVSSKDGTFRIPNVPPDEYRIQVFHERATPAALEKQEQRVSVADKPVTIPPIVISESGYLPGPHKNKYGRDYPPVSDDSIAYPGAKK
jgi:plastocyanin